MWNNGNGNQGNGQQSYDVYGGLNSTRTPGGARFPFIEAGNHKLALCILEEFTHSSDGPSARAIFKVLQSNKHAPGSFVVKIWKLVKPPKFQNANKLSDGEEFTDFCRKLKGAPQDYVMANDIRVLMRDQAAAQLARGTVIDCVGVANKKGTWVNIYWNTVQQTPTDIATMRQKLEAEGIPDTKTGQTGGGQFQGAPHPAQDPRPGYQQSQALYGVPPGAQPGFGPTPQQQVQGSPNPAFYPNAATPQATPWGQPQQNAPQGVPQQGVFVPPGQNNGNNGGNGSW